MLEGPYKKLDDFVLRVNPRVAGYRKLGEGLSEIREKRIRSNRSLSPEASEYILGKIDDPKFRAYWSVMAQYSLAVTDIFGQNPSLYDSRTAAERVGDWAHWLAAYDQVSESESFQLHGASLVDRLLNGRATSKGPAESFLVEEYHGMTYPVRAYMQEVTDLELMMATAPDQSKYNLRGEVGRVIGLAQYEVMKGSLPRLPERASEFLALNGVATVYFDDLKDFSKDRNEGTGYQYEMRPRLFSGAVRNMARAFTLLLPLERKRHIAFCELAGLFQLRELLGMKERT